MPHIIISTSTASDYFTTAGPTVVGDNGSDGALMQYLRAQRSPFGTYECPEGPRWVLDKLEAKGYRVVAMSSVTKTNSNRITSFWTLQGPPIQSQSQSQSSTNSSGSSSSGHRSSVSLPQ